MESSKPQRITRLSGRVFVFFGLNTPTPEFRGILRETGPRSLTRHAQGSDPPWERTLLHGEAEKPTSAVGVASPKAVPRRGGGLTFGRRAAATGGLAAHGGAVSAAGGATFGRSGGARRAEAGAGGQKSRTRGRNRVPGVCAGSGDPGKTGASRGFIQAPCRAKKRAAPGQNGAFGWAKRRVRRALGAKKPLFAAKKAGNGAVLGRKLAEKAGGACRVIWHLQGIFGRFRRKSWGLRKSLSARI